MGALRVVSCRYPNGRSAPTGAPKGLVGEARLYTNPLAPDNGHRNEPRCAAEGAIDHQ